MLTDKMMQHAIVGGPNFTGGGIPAVLTIEDADRVADAAWALFRVIVPEPSRKPARARIRHRRRSRCCDRAGRPC